MILNENEIYLKKQYPKVWDSFNLLNKQSNSVEMTPIVSKTGLPSLRIEIEGQQIYLHSKYDPMNEAKQWIHGYEEQIPQFNHIFFYGIGFAYHIEYLMHKYPDKLFTLYEPNPIIFYEYLCHRILNEMPLTKLKFLYVEKQSENIENLLQEITNQFSEEFMIIIHPVYERIFQEKTKQFLTIFKQLLYNKRGDILYLSETNQLWSLNGVNNFKKVLSTPNLLREKKNFFKGKPVLMVAAGPSLEEEIDNIRLIKEQGLAYVFAIGSANKALLSHNIYPDAICTYDPYDHNIQVFDKIIQDNISGIPLIFGSSVGFKTLLFYPGPMLHMITDRDNVSRYYLKCEELYEKNEVIYDQPTIAVLTMKMLEMLGCELIILAGQNFAFKDNQFYSKGIHYNYRSNEISAKEIKDSLFVESVEGEQILSGAFFNVERLAMEQLIRDMKGTLVINTTKGGAKIAGTEFVELKKVISEKLKEKIVDSDWYKVNKFNYNQENIMKQSDTIGKHHRQIPDLLTAILNTLKEINRVYKYNDNNRLNKLNNQLSYQLNKLVKNAFFDTFIKYELILQTDLLNRTMDPIRSSNNINDSISIVIEAHFKYIVECQRVYDARSLLFINFQEYLRVSL